MIGVFVGPTLRPEQVREVLPEAVILPPVAQGDVYALMPQRPRALGIIDGFFERVPAVWHKEILWALKEGVHVYGAASMGALRAAELEPFGVVGVGSIYQAYLQGALERDDEVAVMHGPAESGYAQLSVALVDVRASLRAATRAGALTPPDAQRVLAHAAALHYPERRWPTLLEVLDGEAAAGMAAWLPTGAVSQKERDALAMLHVMAEALRQDPPRKEVSFHFQYTDFWRQACQRQGRRPLLREARQDELVLDELRLQGPAAWEQAMQAGMERALAAEHGRAQGLRPNSEAQQRAAALIRARHGLAEEPEAQLWMHRQGLDAGEMQRLAEREAQLQAVRQMMRPELAAHLVDHLRVTGRYAALQERALAKRAASARPEGARIEDEGVEAAQILAWYFRDRLGVEVPEDPDAWARALDLPHREVWMELLTREFLFAREAQM